MSGRTGGKASKTTQKFDMAQKDTKSKSSKSKRKESVETDFTHDPLFDDDPQSTQQGASPKPKGFAKKVKGLFSSNKHSQSSRKHTETHSPLPSVYQQSSSQAPGGGKGLPATNSSSLQSETTVGHVRLLEDHESTTSMQLFPSEKCSSSPSTPPLVEETHPYNLGQSTCTSSETIMIPTGGTPPATKSANIEESRTAGREDFAHEECTIGKTPVNPNTQKLLAKKLKEVNDLNKRIQELEENIKAKDKECETLQAKLDEREREHEQELKIKLSELEDAQILAESKFEKEKQSLADQLAEISAKSKKVEEEKQSLADQIVKNKALFQTKNECHEVALKEMVKAQGEVQRIKQSLQEKEEELATVQLDNQKQVANLSASLESAKNDVSRGQLEVQNMNKELSDLQAQLQAASEQKQTEIEEVKTGLIENQKAALSAQEDELRLAHTKEIEELRAQLERQIENKTETVQEGKTPQGEEKLRAKINAELRVQYEGKLMQALLEKSQEHKRECERICEEHNRALQEKVEELTESHLNEIEAKSAALTKEKEVIQSKLEEECKFMVLAEREKANSQISEQLASEEDARIQKLKTDFEMKMDQLRAEHRCAVEELNQKHQDETAALQEQTRILEQEYISKLKKAEHRHSLCQLGFEPPPNHIQSLGPDGTAELNEGGESQFKVELETKLGVREQQIRDLQYELNHLKEQFGQLQIQSMAKQQLSPSDGDVNPLPFPGPSEASIFGETKVEPSSSIIEIPELSKFLNTEAVLSDAKERSLDNIAVISAVKALGLPEPSKHAYVFAVFPASQQNTSIVLDFTAVQQCTDHSLHIDNSLSDSDDEFHSLDGEDNRTDVQKLEESQKETELLRRQLATMTAEHEQLRSSYQELRDAVKTAAVEKPVPATGVEEGDEAVKKVSHMKTMYLQQVIKTMEAEENFQQLQAQFNDLNAKHDISIQKHMHLKKELTAKIQEKDHELRQIRAGSLRPPTSSSDSFDELSDDTDPIAHISELRAALKSKDEKIGSLLVQANSFEQIATQHKQLQQNNKIQSTTVLHLRRKVEALESELEEARSSAHRVTNAHQEMAKIQAEKVELEDEKQILEKEMSAERDNNVSLMKQLAESHTTVAKPQETLRTTPGSNVTGEDEKDQEISLLKTEATLHQIEVEECRRKAERSQKGFADMERAKQSLERKLKKVADERDNLAKDILKVQLEHRKVKEQLTYVGIQHGATIELAETLSQSVEKRDAEVCELKGEKAVLEQKLEELQTKFDLVKFQAQQYEEDFKQEREDCGRTAGVKDAEIKELQDELDRSHALLNDERNEKRDIINKLDAERKEKWEIIGKVEAVIQQYQQKQPKLDQLYDTYQQDLIKTKEDKQDQVCPVISPSHPDSSSTSKNELWHTLQEKSSMYEQCLLEHQTLETSMATFRVKMEKAFLHLKDEKDETLKRCEAEINVCKHQEEVQQRVIDQQNTVIGQLSQGNRELRTEVDMQQKLLNLLSKEHNNESTRLRTTISDLESQLKAVEVAANARQKELQADLDRALAERRDSQQKSDNTIKVKQVEIEHLGQMVHHLQQKLDQQKIALTDMTSLKEKELETLKAKHASEVESAEQTIGDMKT